MTPVCLAKRQGCRKGSSMRCYSASSLRAFYAAPPKNPFRYPDPYEPDNSIRLIEVGPRDGLQNEKKPISLGTKIKLIEKLAMTGLTVIEAGSFVSPKWVPQMEHSSEILEHILKHKIPTSSTTPITYSFLAPNVKGFESAAVLAQNNEGAYVTHSEVIGEMAKSGLPALELAVFVASTETFSKKNLNCDIATSIKRSKPVIEGAKRLGFRTRAYLSVVLGCPFEGTDVKPQKVTDIAASLLEMGVDEISLGDTTGMGTAPRTRALLRSIASVGIRRDDIAMHFHDTYGQALVNTVVALENGIRAYDTAVGGLGGCPYSPGATGNVATEKMIYFMESLGLETGVDLDAVVDIGEWIAGELGKPNTSTIGKAVLGARKRRLSGA